MAIFFFREVSNEELLSDFLLLTRDQVNIKERYVILKNRKISIDDSTAYCLLILMSKINYKHNRLFLIKTLDFLA
jgi:hypothetical protein